MLMGLNTKFMLKVNLGFCGPAISSLRNLRNWSQSGTLVDCCWPTYYFLNQKLPFWFVYSLKYLTADSPITVHLDVWVNRYLFFLQQRMSASSQSLNLLQKIPTRVTSEGGNNINFNNTLEYRVKNIQEVFRVDRAQGVQGMQTCNSKLKTCKTASNDTISLGNWSIFFSISSNPWRFIVSWSKTHTANHANSNWTAFLFLHKLKGLISTLHCNCLL